MSTSQTPAKDLALTNLAVKQTVVADTVVCRKLVTLNAVEPSGTVGFTPASGFTIVSNNSKFLVLDGQTLVSIALILHADSSVMIGFPPTTLGILDAEFSPVINTVIPSFIMSPMVAVILTTLHSSGAFDSFSPGGPPLSGPFDLCLSATYVI